MFVFNHYKVFGNNHYIMKVVENLHIRSGDLSLERSWRKALFVQRRSKELDIEVKAILGD